MALRTYSKWVVIVGTLIIWIIKFLVRPYMQLGDTAQFICGVAPNLLGSFLIPFGAFWLYTHSLFFNGRLLRFYFFSDNRFVCLFGFALVVINEYLQLIPVFGRTFDYFDILSSAVGLLAAYYVFSAVQRRLAPL